MEETEILDLKNNLMNFTEYPWHDAILKGITIDRSNPGYNDIVKIVIVWETGIENNVIFNDVYFAQLNLNFGVIAEECVSEVKFLPTSDTDVTNFLKKWRGIIEDIEDLLFIEIKTISTGSSIKIFAKKVSVE